MLLADLGPSDWSATGDGRAHFVHRDSRADYLSSLGPYVNICQSIWSERKRSHDPAKSLLLLTDDV